MMPDVSIKRNFPRASTFPATPAATELALAMRGGSVAALSPQQRRQRVVSVLRSRLTIPVLLTLPLYAGRIEQFIADKVWTPELEGLIVVPQNLNAYAISAIVRAGLTVVEAGTAAASVASVGHYVLMTDKPLRALPSTARWLARLFEIVASKILLPVVKRVVRRTAIRVAGRALQRAAVTAAAAVASGPFAPAVAAVGFLVNGAFVALDAYLVYDVVAQLGEQRDRVIADLVDAMFVE